MASINLENLINAPKDAAKLQQDVPVIDADWLNSKFITPTSKLPDIFKENRFVTTTSLKYTDSSLGGNICVNPRPQYTRYADVKPDLMINRTSDGSSKVKLTTAPLQNNSTTIGMGDFHSRAYDDNQQLLYLEFGLPKFNNMTSFLTRSIDYNAATFANTGRVSSAHTMGQYIGFAIMAVAFPMVSLAVYSGKQLLELAGALGNYNYYYMEPNMHLYWSTVNNILTELLTEQGLLIPEFIDKEKPDSPGEKTIGKNIRFNQEDIDEFKKYMPGIISDSNYVDVFQIALKAQAKANQQRVNEKKALEEDENMSFTDILLNPSLWLDEIDYQLTFEDYRKEVKSYIGDQKGDTPPTMSEADIEAAKKDSSLGTKYTANKDGTYTQAENKSKASYTEKTLSAVSSAMRQGGGFACFAVDYTGSSSESFSNSSSSISTGDKIKSITGKARDVKFDLAGGNIIPGIDELVSGVGNLLSGVLDSVTFGLANAAQTAAGGAFIDVPLKWDDSSSQIGTQSYTMDLISPYAHPIAQIQNMYLPLCMLFAGAMPLSSGKSSYASPMLCSAFSRGVQRMSMGMIQSLRIERGTSNLGFNRSRRPLALKVTVEFMDFSTLTTAPVNPSVFSDIFTPTINDDTPYGNYIAMLGGRDILTNKYATKRAKIKISRSFQKWDQFLSPSSLGMRIDDNITNIFGAFVSNRSLTDTNTE